MQTLDAATITLAEAEKIAKAEHSINLRYPDMWEMMIWYAPGAPATEANGGIGYLWRQLRLVANKHGKTSGDVIKSTCRGTIGDERGWVTRAEAERFHEDARA